MLPSGNVSLAGLYRSRGQHADVFVMAAWYCERPMHIVRHKLCDPHHPILGLLSLVDEVESAIEPRERDDKQKAVHAAARRNNMVGANLALKRALNMLSTADDSGDDERAAEHAEENLGALELRSIPSKDG